MTTVDCVASVDIGAYRISITLILTKDFSFMSAGVGTENMSLIDIVGICGAPTRMIPRKAQRIEVLSDSNDGRQALMMSICWSRKAGLDQLANQRDWVVTL